MKRKSIITVKLSELKKSDFVKNSLPLNKLDKIKGGVNPWVEGPG